MLSVPGIGSGLDVTSIVEGLMEAESVNLKNLQAKETVYKAQLSAYGTLKSKVSNFESAMKDLSSIGKFAIYQTTSSNEDKFTATAGSAASEGNYTILVNSIAQAHKVASNSFVDSSTSVGATGTMQITVDSESFTIDIDSSNDTLTGIKDAINNSTDNSTVKATLININDGAGGTESRLVLTSIETGAANTISFSDVSGNVAATLNVTKELTAASDAEIDIDGYTATRTTNTFSDVLEGVTFTLKEAETTTPLTLTISRDDEAVKENIQAFIDSYNDLLTTIDSLKDFELANDSSLRQIKTDLRRIFYTPVSGAGSFDMLAEIGITSDTNDGKLKLNSSELTNAMNSDFSSVAKLFGDSDQGYAVKFENLASNFLGDSGIIQIRTDGLNSRITSIGNRIEKEEIHLESQEEKYKSQFNALDALISNLNATSDYLTQQFNQMSNNGSKK